MGYIVGLSEKLKESYGGFMDVKPTTVNEKKRRAAPVSEPGLLTFNRYQKAFLILLAWTSVNIAFSVSCVMWARSIVWALSGGAK